MSFTINKSCENFLQVILFFWWVGVHLDFFAQMCFGLLCVASQTLSIHSLCLGTANKWPFIWFLCVEEAEEASVIGKQGKALRENSSWLLFSFFSVKFSSLLGESPKEGKKRRKVKNVAAMRIDNRY